MALAAWHADACRRGRCVVELSGRWKSFGRRKFHFVGHAVGLCAVVGWWVGRAVGPKHHLRGSSAPESTSKDRIQGNMIMIKRSWAIS